MVSFTRQKAINVFINFLVLALSMPVSALDLKGTANGKNFTVGYLNNGNTPATRARAFALQVSVSDGAKITAISGYKMDGSGYGIYPASIAIDNQGTVTSFGSPIEPNGLPLGGSLPSSSIIVAMGSLYKASDAATMAPPVSGNLFTVIVDKFCNVTVQPETAYRGGIIAEDGNELIVRTLINNQCICEPECMKPTAPEYADWVAWNRPSCWCYRFQCWGDINGKTSFGKPISTIDLNMLKTAFNLTNAQLQMIPEGICADIDHRSSFGRRVTTSDLNILKMSWTIVPLPHCPMTYLNWYTN